MAVSYKRGTPVTRKPLAHTHLSGAGAAAGGSDGAPGKFQVQLGGKDAGDVDVHTEPAPPVPQPMVVRYGDVVAKPAGCPNCPVSPPD